MIRFFFFFFCSFTALSQVVELSAGGGETRLTNAGLGKVTADSPQPNDYDLTGGFRINMRMTLNSSDHGGHEFGYAYNRAHLVGHAADGYRSEQGMAIHQGFYNYLLYPTQEGARFRPFIAGGGHFNNYVPPGASAASGGGSTEFGVNYGAGVKIRVTEKFLWRLDVRQYINPKPFGLMDAGGWIKMNEFSMSLAFVL